MKKNVLYGMKAKFSLCIELQLFLGLVSTVMTQPLFTVTDSCQTTRIISDICICL